MIGFISLISFCLILHPGICSSNINILSYPSSLEFGEASAIKVSNLENVLAASLGYSTTTEGSSWNGLKINSPFNYPLAAVIFDIPTDGASVSIDGTSYELIEDMRIDDSFAYLHNYIYARAQRPIRFKTIQADENEVIFKMSLLPELEHLKMTDPADAQFLREVTMLPLLMQKLGNMSSKSAGGQDIFIVSVDSFAVLVKNYGKESKQVSEAGSVLREAISQSTDKLRKIYDEKVLVLTLLTSRSETLSRQTRSLLQKKPTAREYYFEVFEETTVMPITNKTINLAAVYREDFPVVFNMVLILGIMFTVAILAASMSMAYMDPGRDSIIYRMTNPRMKKD